MTNPTQHPNFILHSVRGTALALALALALVCAMTFSRP